MEDNKFNKHYSQITVGELINKLWAHKTMEFLLDKKWYEALINHLPERDLTDEERKMVDHILNSNPDLLIEEERKEKGISEVGNRNMNTYRENIELAWISPLIIRTIISFLGALLLFVSIFFVINLSNNLDRQFSDLYILLWIAYFLAGFSAAFSCARYTKSIRGTSLNLIAIIASFCVVLLFEISFLGFTELLKTVGPNLFDLHISEPPKQLVSLQTLRGASINGIIAYSLGYGVVFIEEFF